LEEEALTDTRVELEKLGHMVLGTLVREVELHETGGYPRRNVEIALECGRRPIVVSRDVDHMDRRSVGCSCGSDGQ
jgi:hypothetical protein